MQSYSKNTNVEVEISVSVISQLQQLCRHLLFVVVQRLECGEDGRAAFTEVHPQIPVQTLSELLACKQRKKVQVK